LLIESLAIASAIGEPDKSALRSFSVNDQKSTIANQSKIKDH
jgi:hypothetical protein